jgi:DNA primase
MLDGDNAGRTAMTKLLNVLGKITEVYPIFLESNKDPDDLSDDHLLKFVAPLIPF